MAEICSGDRARIWSVVSVRIAAELADAIWAVVSVAIWSAVYDLKLSHG